MKLCVICRGSQHFLRPMIRHWRDELGWTLVTRQEDADVVWVEWANEQSVAASHRALRRNVIVRMLGSEWYQYFWRQWKRENVAAVIQSSGVTLVPGIEHHVIPPGIDTNYWTPNGEPRENVCISVGGMNYAKNQLGFLRVLAERPKFFDRVLFIGDTEGAGLSPEGGINARKLALLCEVYAKKHGIPLEITGKLPPEQLLSWYRRARVHAIPALNSYGSVIGEGMACGCPTITWDWWGAETHWPQEMIVATAPMFWQKIQTMTEGGPTTQWNADMMRDWVVTRLDVKVTQEQTDKVIEAVACSGSR